MTDPNHIAEARKKVSRPHIREVFLRNGAHIEPGHDDLPDYVYESVFELLEMAAPDVQGEPIAWATRLYNTGYHAGHHDTVEGGYTHVYPQDMDSHHEDIVQEWLADNPQPVVQGEPVGWQFYQDGKWWHGDDRIKDHRKNTEEAGFRVRDAYAAPQPAEQQPQPESATHYRPSTGVYYQVIDGKTYAWRDAKVGWMPSPRKGIPDDCVCLMPSEQQPAQDVAGLVEALERFIGAWADCQQQPVHAEEFEILTDICEDSMKLLAAYRKQGGEV